MKVTIIHLIKLSAALECIGWSSITVVLPSLHDKLGLTSAQVSYIAAITGLTSLFSAGLQGFLSDHFSKVNLLKLSSFGQGISQLVLGLYALNILNSWPLFVAMRILAAALKMGMIVSQAYVVDHLRATDPNAADSQRTALISSLMSWSNMGFLIGPVLGGFMAHNLSYPFAFSVCVFCANVGVLSMVSDDTLKDKGRKDRKQSALGCITVHNADPERGMSPYSTSGRRIGGRATLAERSSIGLRGPTRRRFSTDGDDDEGRLQDEDNFEQNDKKRRPNSTGPSLFFLLHIKFAFQISNTIYETLFAQHLQKRLQATPEQLGWMMSTVGLQAAVVNGLVVPRLISSERDSNWLLLVLCSLGQTAGTVLWALALSLQSSFAGAVIIGLSSNVFLSLLQGMLGSAPAPGKAGGHNKAGRGSRREVNAGMTYGLSTIMDRGARALAPLLAAASLQTHLHVPALLYHFIGQLGPGAGVLPGATGQASAGLALSVEEAEALSVVHANEVLGLALVCACGGFYTLCLLASWYVAGPRGARIGSTWVRLKKPAGIAVPPITAPSLVNSGYPTTP